MSPFKDLTNTKINNWNVMSFEGFDKNEESTWKSQCDCIDKTTEIKTISSVKRTMQCKKCNTRDRIEAEIKYFGEYSRDYGHLTGSDNIE